MNKTCSSLARISRRLIQTNPLQHKAFQRARRFDSTRLCPNKIFTMAATTTSLADTLKSLDLGKPLPTYPNCYPEYNPTDVYRAHITEILAEVTGVDPAIVYPALQWTQTLEKGDLVLPVPALRVKGKKPNELAEEWAAKVA